MSQKVQYIYHPNNLQDSEPSFYQVNDLEDEDLLINIGPQHPSTHGVLRLEVLTDGEIVKQVIPHLGYLHRCFEKHAENLPYNQIIPYVDRLDYLGAMNNEHIYCMAVEKMLGIEKDLDPRVEYIRVLMAELNRLASHFIALGTYAADIGALTPFLWLVRDREHILRLLEWVSGARMLYNYIWIGGLYYDLPVGCEERCLEFTAYIKPKLTELEQLVQENKIFIERTANLGVLPLETAINYGVTGPILRASGLKFDLRKVDGYSVYPELDFDIPIGKGIAGTVGDCWDRNYVRIQECKESVKIIEQCLVKLTTDHKRTRAFDPRKACPKKILPPQKDIYFRGEATKGELGFFIRTEKNRDIPQRVKVRAGSFSNLMVLDTLSKNVYLADLIAIIGSLDFVLGEVDR
jgi:NADH-quinone oxidoreductase subunit D